jgi:demethylmacrocin O-methyltransferase
MLEIGIGGDGEGGYSAPDKGGESLRMWKAFFPRARVNGLDIHDKTGLRERRISIWHGSQIDKSILDKIAGVPKGLQLVIDDGSHRCEHVIQTFEILFPQINPGAFYIIEDTQTSYWPEYGGDISKHDPTGHTTMGYFKKLADGVNHSEFRLEDYRPTYFDTHIESVAFYHNLIVIKKV